MSSRDNPATGKQLHAIAVLCLALGERKPLEDEPMTIGQAGRLYRELAAEQRGRRIDARAKRAGVQARK